MDKPQPAAESANLLADNTIELPRISPPTKSGEEEFRLGQGRILELIATSAPLDEILSRLVRTIESQSPGMLCSVLLLSEDGEHIRHGAAPSLPQDYVKAIDGLPIGPKHGSCGTAMFRGEPVVVSDIETDPLWEDFRQFALDAGLRACWSTPILSGRGKVLGSFAMYYREPRKPTGAEAGFTEVATRIAGLAIEHHLGREILQRTQAELAVASHAASAREAMASMASKLAQQLEDIATNADLCLSVLNEDKPELALLRQPLKAIAGDSRQALETLNRTAKR